MVEMSIFIKIDILKPSLIKHFKKKVSIFINIDKKNGNYPIILDINCEVKNEDYDKDLT
jgi:hypothetical protein